MFRTVIRSVGAAAALAVLVCLVGCGPVRVGAAAIVGTQRISTSTLSGEVADLNEVYQAHPALRRNVQYTTAQMPRLVLMWLVRFRVISDIARHNGVQVTAADAQGALATVRAQAGQQAGAPVSSAQFALLSAVPPRMAGQFGRYQATIEKLALLYTGAKNLSSLTQAQQQQFSKRIQAELAAAVKRLNIKINPRFGRLNAAQLSIVATPDRLSRPGTSA